MRGRDFSLFFMGNMEKVRICKGQWYHFRNQFMVSLKQTSRYANSHICQLILLATYSSPANSFGIKGSMALNYWNILGHICSSRYRGVTQTWSDMRDLSFIFSKQSELC